MKINGPFDVQAKPDGKNIIVFESPRKNSTGTPKRLKAFQIAKHIWVVPERYYGEELVVNDSHKQDGGIYDSEYLTTSDVEKQAFLDNIRTLFERINNTDFGKRFLSLLTSAVPLPIKESNKLKAINGLYDMGGEDYHIANLIIFGPGVNLMDMKVLPLNLPYASNARGIASELCFTPHITSEFGEYVQDPALTLWSKLIEVLHSLYGIRIPDEYALPYHFIGAQNIYSKCTCEEILIAGGQDYEYAQNHPNWPRETYFQETKNKFEAEIKNMGKELENWKTTTDYDDVFYQYLMGKFSVDIESIWELTAEKMANYLGVECQKHYYYAKNSIVRPRYYYLNFSVDYSNSGFMKGQKNRNYKEYTAQYLFKRPSIHSCYESDLSSKYCADIFEQALQTISNEYYIITKIKQQPIDSTNILNKTNSKNKTMESFDANTVDKLAEINYDRFHKVEISSLPELPQYPSTKMETVKVPITEHYISAQNAELISGNNVMFTSSFNEKIKKQGVPLVYSPLKKLVNYFNADIIKTLKTEEKISTWLEEIILIFKSEVEAIQLVNTIEGVSLIVPWISQSLNVLNNSSKGNFLENIEFGGVNGLIEYPVEFRYPTIESLTFKNVTNKYSTIDEVNRIIKNVELARQKQWEAVYNFTLQQWWSTFHFQFVKRLYQIRESLFYQIQAIKKHIFNSLSEIAGATANNIADSLVKKGHRAVERLQKSAQAAIEYINESLSQCSIAYFKHDILPGVLNKLKVFDKVTFEQAEIFLENNIVNSGETIKEKWLPGLERIKNKKILFKMNNLPNSKDLLKQISIFDEEKSLNSLITDFICPI